MSQGPTADKDKGRLVHIR